MLRIGLDDDGRMRALPQLGYQGAVIEAMGAGHVPAWLAPDIGELAARMPVVLSTRVAAGPVLRITYGFPGSESDLLSRGAIHGGSLGGLKARLLLRLLLAAGYQGASLRAEFACQPGRRLSAAIISPTQEFPKCKSAMPHSGCSPCCCSRMSSTP